MCRVLLTIGLFVFLLSCSKEETIQDPPLSETSDLVSAVDISRFPEISKTNPVFLDTDKKKNSFLNILKENGVNTIRLRLWVDPVNEHSGYEEVRAFSKTLKDQGFRIWLTLHYSDTWADPGNQSPPARWQNLEFDHLKDSVYRYTANICKGILPDYIQIGNEINTGIMHPYGRMRDNQQKFIALLKTGAAAVRENAAGAKVILHFAGFENSPWFFEQVKDVDFDIIGLSYYPKWHGKSLADLSSAMERLSATHQKKIMIAETAYPFTLGWNDWTNNIIGSEDQLILPAYPATPEGQKDFIKELKQITLNVDGGMGFCYWGAELIAWKGPQSQDASPWENQALFDFDLQALPVLKEFDLP